MKSDLILALIFLGLALIGAVLKKAYYTLTEDELKRQAEAKDHRAIKLYKVVAYGPSFKMLVWLYLSLTTAVSMVLFVRSLATWLSIIVVALIIYLIFWLLPASPLTQTESAFASFMAPAVTWLLNYLHPLFNRVLTLLNYRPRVQHTRLYEPSDLLKFIRRQQQQIDNRISQADLNIVKRALSFNDKTLTQALIPKKEIKVLLSSDNVGPILINELHENPHDFALVKDTAKGPIVGSLAAHELSIRSHGQVKDLMNENLYYLHEDDTLDKALQALGSTQQPLFIVINSNQDFLGMLTKDSLVKQLIGNHQVEDKRNYSDRQAIANKLEPMSEEIQPDNKKV